MKPGVLLSFLVAFGIIVGGLLSQRGKYQIEAPSPAPANPVSPSAQPPPPAPDEVGGEPKEDLKKQITILEGQVEYLQGQVQALQEENAAMLQKLGTLGMKGGAPVVPIPAPPDVDYVSLGVDLMATRKLQALPVAVIPAPQAEVEKIILAWLRRQLPGDASQRQGRALAALGVIPEAVDVLPLRSALLARQVCGWYDAEKDTLFVVDAAAAPPGTMPPPTEPVLAMAHGQLLREFQKTLLPERTALTTDARLAREALLGGDAGLVRLLHGLKNPRAPDPTALPAEDPDHPLNQVPMPVFLRELELFPFSRGFEFAQSLHSLGEFQQVTNAYSRPPVSTAEILDTEAYLVTDRPPATRVDWSGAEDFLKQSLWDDVLGQFASFTFLRAYSATEDAAEATKGWLADRLLAFPAKDGPRDHAVWQTLWRDAGSARAFFTALGHGLAQRYDQTAGDAKSASVEFTAQGRHVRLAINRQGAGVLLVDAADAAFAKTARDKLE